ncbi:MAG: type II toxin-antitoxin system HicB family antitoxin [Armatimonadetes bacterium]|nr:type II toxin-antitoxin system HicB family antitoxin [Armatimonadota bacterium]
MTLKVLIHKAEEGGYWAEVPSLPGCFTQGETLDQVRERAREAILAYLGLDEDLSANPRRIGG